MKMKSTSVAKPKRERNKEEETDDAKRNGQRVVRSNGSSLQASTFPSN